MKQNKIYNCTLLLITHERPEFIKKTYKYYKKLFEQIIILDSSKKKNVLFKNLKNYYHCSDLNLVQKVLLGFKNSKTKYTIIAPDDDFFFSHSIMKGISFLDKNKKYISVSGKYYWFEKIGPFKKYTLLYKNSYYDIDHLKPLQRFKEVCNKPTSQMLYNLYRTKEILKFLIKFKNFKQSSFLEDIFILLPPLFGRHKFLETNWMLRDGSVNMSYNTNVQTELINFTNLDNNKRKAQKIIYNNFLKSFIDLNRQFNMNLNPKIIIKLIRNFYSKSKHPHRGIKNDNNLIKSLKHVYRFFYYNVFFYRYYFYFTEDDKKCIRTVFRL